jgi:hypothetical protein
MTASMVLLPFVVHADDLPCVYPSMAQVRPDVRAAVQDAPAPEGLTYLYSVTNRTTAQQVLQSFAVEVQGSGSAVVGPLPPPTSWEVFGYIAQSRFYSWVTVEEPVGLRSGERGTFRVRVRETLPVIGSFLAWGKVDPPSFPEGREPETCEGIDVLKNNFKGATIGPDSCVAPSYPVNS